MFIRYLFNFSDLLEPYISLLVWRHSLGLSGWMMLSGAWALWRLCVSDFYQGKPIRPDRGMMILGHHHSGDTAPTNPTTPSSIRQPKTPSHAPAFPCSPSLSSSLILPLHSFLFFVFFFLVLRSRQFPSSADCLWLLWYSPQILIFIRLGLPIISPLFTFPFSL